MESKIDGLAKRLAARVERRQAVKGLGALGLGVLGAGGVRAFRGDDVAEAKSCKNNKDCPNGKTCKNKKKQNNGKRRGRCK